MVKDELIGKKLGSYQLVQLLGHGAFGSVYLGKHFILSHKPPVAIKVLNSTLNTQEEFDRFFHEAMLLDTLTHPHILPVIDANVYEDYPFFVAEYAPGGSLSDRLDQLKGNPMSLEEALDLLNQVGQGLQFAHDHNVVHRDLKPANILFNAQGEALLADFGIAVSIKKTRRADEIGTPAYMSPEQFKGKISKRSDQYALGCIAYELLTGQQLFTAEDPYTIGFKHIYEPPVAPSVHNPNISPAIEKVILKALSKQRNERYPTVTDFIEALYEAANIELETGIDEGYEQDEFYDDEEEIYAEDEQDGFYDDEAAEPNKSTLNNRYRATRTSSRQSRTPIFTQHQESSESLINHPPSYTPRQTTSTPHMVPLWIVKTGIDHAYYAEPTVANGIVYAGIYSTSTTDWNNNGQTQLQALDAVTGEQIWSFDTEYGIYDAPVVGEGIVYFCSAGVNNGGTIYALDADTGEHLWSFETESSLKATPTVANDIVYAHSQHVIYALNAATGQQYWSVTLKAALFNHPIVIDSVVYIATERGHCYAVDADRGHKIATFADVGEVHAAIGLDESIICICAYEDHLYALNTTTGETLWALQIDRHISGNMTVADGIIYFGSNSGFVGDSARTKLSAVDSRTGKLRWVTHIRNEIEGAPVVEDGVIYVSTFGREISAIHTEEGKHLFSTKVGRRKISRSVIENAMLFVSTGDLNAFHLE